MGNREDQSKRFHDLGAKHYKDGKNCPPKDNLIFHPKVFTADGVGLTIDEAQSAYDAGRSDAGRNSKK